MTANENESRTVTTDAYSVSMLQYTKWIIRVLHSDF